MQEERVRNDQTVTITAAAVGPQAYRSEYPRQESSVPQVRGDIRAIVSTWCLEDLLDEAEWIACELYTNAIRHGRGTPRIDVRRKGSGMEISVSDTSREVPRLRAATSDQEGGRGLLLVDTLASSWGVSPTRGGKRVWALLVR